MLSPPIEIFLDILKGHFRNVKTERDKELMTHLIATGKRKNFTFYSFCCFGIRFSIGWS